MSSIKLTLQLLISLTIMSHGIVPCVFLLTPLYSLSVVWRVCKASIFFLFHFFISVSLKIPSPCLSNGIYHQTKITHSLREREKRRKTSPISRDYRICHNKQMYLAGSKAFTDSEFSLKKAIEILRLAISQDSFVLLLCRILPNLPCAYIRCSYG